MGGGVCRGCRGKGCPKVAQNVLKHALVLEFLSFNEFFFRGRGDPSLTASRHNNQPNRYRRDQIRRSARRRI